MVGRIAELSTAKRLKVGALIVDKDQKYLVYGYNGTPPGKSNDCEILLEDGTLVTKPEVIHAECNAIYKAAKRGISTENATLFLTHSPCFDCAKAIVMSGILVVNFINEYRDRKGLDFLLDNWVVCLNSSGDILC